MLAGRRPLVVIEGASGAGKTPTLAAIRQAREEQDRRHFVVTPTPKAAKVAQKELGAAAGSAAAVAYAYGWRWNDDGAWTRLSPGQVDSAPGRDYTGPAELMRLQRGICW